MVSKTNNDYLFIKKFQQQDTNIQPFDLCAGVPSNVQDMNPTSADNR